MALADPKGHGRIVSPRIRQLCVIVSIAVSQLSSFSLNLGYTINAEYFRDLLPTPGQLTEICNIAGDVFNFQQDNPIAHCVRDTIELSVPWETLVHHSWHAASQQSCVMPKCVQQVPIQDLYDLVQWFAATSARKRHGGWMIRLVSGKKGREKRVNE